MAGKENQVQDASEDGREGGALEAGTRRKARLAGRRERTRNDILQAARKVLLEGGPGAVTLEAVGIEAGMSKTAIYYYFPSKDALLFEMVFSVFERHARSVHDAVEAAADGKLALRAIIARTMRDFSGNPR